jgi:DNA-binding transcriptional LysR family regulator
MILTLRQIEVFRAVMATRSFVGAARLLRIAQPTVTKAVARIEDRLGVSLFVRQGGRIYPTSEAVAVLAEIDRAFVQLEQAVLRVDKVARSGSGVLRLGAAPSIGRRLIPAVLGSWLDSHPDLTLQIDILSVARVLDYVLNGTGDCAVSLFPIAHGAVRSELVGRARLVCVLPHETAARLGPVIRPADIDGLPLITFEPDTAHGNAVARFLQSGNTRPGRTHLVLRMAETAVGLAEAGLGIALVDEFSALSADREKLTVRPVAFEPPFQIYLHINHERPTSRTTQAFRQALIDHLGAIDSRGGVVPIA